MLHACVIVTGYSYSLRSSVGLTVMPWLVVGCKIVSVIASFDTSVVVLYQITKKQTNVPFYFECKCD